jgi:hypothetical protein
VVDDQVLPLPVQEALQVLDRSRDRSVASPLQVETYYSLNHHSERSSAMATIWPDVQDPRSEEYLYDEMQCGGDVPDGYDQFLADQTFGYVEMDCA